MRGRVALLAGIVLAIGVVIAVVSLLIETDEERIEQVVEDMREAAAARDVEAVLAHVDEAVAWPGGLGGLRRQVAQVIQHAPPTSISAEVSDLDVDGDGATGVVEVWYRSQVGLVRERLRVGFGRCDGRWLVTGIER